MQEMKKIIPYDSINFLNIDLPFVMSKRLMNSDSKGFFLHWHDQIELYYVIEGGLALLCNGQKQWLYQGDIGFINWCEPHRGMEFLDHTEYYILQIDIPLFDTQLFTQTNQLHLSSIPSFIYGNSSLANTITQLFHEYTNQPVGYELMSKSLIYKIITELIRLPESYITLSKQKYNKSALDYITGMLKYITNHYTQPITLEELSHYFGLSKSYMCHIFKEHTGTTILNYINEIRCSHGASLILNGIPLCDVYQSIGYNDYNYFSRIFKKIYGTSPRNFKTCHID